MSSSQLPIITWPDFLLEAPYFIQAITEAIYDGDTELPELPPLPRALVYWNIIDGEVTNGGVSQYFYNQADYLPGFEQVPEFLAAHPLLKQYLHFAERVYAAWAEVAPVVRQARSSDEGPEAFFKHYAEKFDALETEFYAVNQHVSCALNQHILQCPQDYINIAPLSEVPDKGVAWVACRGKGYRGQLRFSDGFPVGPNVFERGKEGKCDVVWFTPDRQLLLVERNNRSNESSNRKWIHYPSTSSGEMRFKNGSLNSQKTSRALWESYGLEEEYSDEGLVKSSILRTTTEVLLRESYYSDGKLLQRIEIHEDGDHRHSYWRNGRLNTHSIRKNGSDIDRYIGCWNEDGDSLALDGNGQLYEILGDDIWREGHLQNGYLKGKVTWYESGKPIRDLVIV
ncbi:DUF4375 domain-containing protein [Serratia sp. DD3]|uniref:DMP19 family protein n=1 Tax=Serratia sp. DD3 TaxID=1410619 RepID=UPI0004DA2100|nr:DUF4375 domain-containing protein [Serratia sp. DD3]KEY59841.1 hypothetical protein SRDD_12290 [Serratia sp. DD3]